MWARQGKLVLPASEDVVEFAAMVADTAAASTPVKDATRPEIIGGPVSIRLEEGASLLVRQKATLACHGDRGIKDHVFLSSDHLAST